MNNPVRLYPKKQSIGERANAFFDKYAYVFLIICFIVLAVLLVILIYTLVGVSATESGVVYNHMDKII